MSGPSVGRAVDTLRQVYKQANLCMALEVLVFAALEKLLGTKNVAGTETYLLPPLRASDRVS